MSQIIQIHQTNSTQLITVETVPVVSNMKMELTKHLQVLGMAQTSISITSGAKVTPLVVAAVVVGVMRRLMEATTITKPFEMNG